METFNKEGVEIFSTGEWNGTKVTKATLEELVSNFNETKSGINPHLKLGHNKEQLLLKAEGLPAAGYVERLYVSGEKLMADFRDIPKKIYQLLEKGAYKKVSIEMFEKVKIKEKEYRNLLVAVALLGADTPGVMNLADIMSMYETELEPKSFDYELTFTQGVLMKTEQEIRDEVIADLQAKADKDKADALETQIAEFTAKQAETDKELKELRQAKADSDKKALEAEVVAKEAKVKEFVAGLKADKLCSAAMEPIITQLLSEGVKEFSVGDKKITKEEALKEALVLFKAASEVNFVENSSEGKKDDSSDQIKELDKEAKEFAAKNNTTYGQALIKVKQSKKKDK